MAIEQSRFLALMSDNERLTQLTEAAYNATGASQQQFNKTLDSMQTKLSQLGNAWDVFTRNLMNSDLLKVGVDLLTSILEVINSITNVFSNFPPVISSAFSITIISAFFTMAKKGATKVLALIANRFKQQTQEIKAEGANAGQGYGDNFGAQANQKITSWLATMRAKIKKFSDQAKAEVTSVTETNVAVPTQEGAPKTGSKEWYKGISARDGVKKGKTGAINLGQKGFSKEEKEAIKQYEIENGLRDKNGKVIQQNVKKTGEEIEKTEKKTSSLSQKTQLLGGAFMAAGVATNFFAQCARKAGAEDGAKLMETIGGIATTLGSLAYMAPSVIDAIKEMGGSFKSTSVYGLIIVAAITGLVYGISTLVKTISKNTLAGKLKTVTTQTEQATASAQKAQEEYSNWLSDKNEYSGLVETLDELVEGTEAWNTKMEELQDKVYDLINTYPELAQYLQTDGTLSDEGFEAYEKKLKEQKELAIGTKTMLQMSQAQLQYEKDVVDIEKQRKTLGDDVANAKIAEVENAYKNTASGYMNVMAQNGGVNGNAAKYISKVYAQQQKQDKLADQAQDHYTGAAADAVMASGFTAAGAAAGITAAGVGFGAASAGATAGAGAAIVAGLATIPVAGWIAAGVVVAAGVLTGIVAAVKKNSTKKELQETYSEVFGIPVEEISDEIKNDVDALAAEIANAKAYQKYIREIASIEQELSLLGTKGSKFLSADMSLLDSDFTDDGGFEKWIEKEKEKVSELSGAVIDEALNTFNAERQKVQKGIQDIFSGKVKMQIDIEPSFSGSIISGENAQKLVEAREKLAESKFFVNTLDDVLSSYGEEQIEVDKLTNSYIELADAVTTTQKAMVAKKMFESNIESVKKLGAEFIATNSATLSATNQIKEFYMNLSVDNMNALYQNGKLTSQSIMEMGESFGDLIGIVDTTDINFATLADTLNDVKSGILSLDSLTDGFVETLDALNKGTHSVEDTLANVQTYTDPTSGTIIGEKQGSVAQSLLELVAEGRYGDPALESYFDFLFGEEAWSNALAQAKENAEQAISQYTSYVATLAGRQNYFDIWAGTENLEGNKYWKVNEDGQTISFDFSDFNSYEQIINKFAEITGHNEDFIKTALADATVWSKDLERTLNNLQKVDTLNNFLETVAQDADKNKNVKISTEQLKKLFDEGFKGQSDFADFEEFKNAIVEQFKSSGYNASTVERYQTLNEVQGNMGKAIAEIGKNSGAMHGVSVKIDSRTRTIPESYYGTLTEDETKKLDDNKHDSVQKSYSEYVNKALIEAGFDLDDTSGKESNKKDIELQHLVMEAIEDQTRYEKASKRYVTTDKNGVPKYRYNYVTESDEIKINGKQITEDEAAQYADQLSQLYQAYMDNGYSSEQAIKEITENYGTEEKIAAQFGLNQNVADFKDIIKPISKLFDKDSQAYIDWTQTQITEDEVANINLAKMINEGTLKAIKYLIDSTGTEEEIAKADENKNSRDYLADRVKQLQDYGYKTSNQINNTTESNLITDFSAEDLGVIVAEQAEAYGNLFEEIMAKQGKEFDFDWLYNFNKWGEKLSQNVENLATAYDLAIKTLSKSTEELSQNLFDQYANMEKQKILSQAKADAANQRMSGMLAENKELKDYAWVDDSDVVQINYDALWAARSDSDTGEKVKTLLDELEKCAEVIQENTSFQNEQSLKQLDFLTEVTDTIIDFKNDVKEMLIESYQKEIDSLSAIDESVNNANSKLVDSIQKSLDHYRQQRDNQKTETDITNRQRRLALLRADTTGSNKGEILSLQKEIDEAQEDYTDTLIDQKLSALQEQNEEASRQRQEQIDIANAQLEAAKVNGLINDKVQDIINNSEKYDGSPLQTLFNDLMSKQGLFKVDWADKTQQMESKLANFAGSSSFSDQYMEGIGKLKGSISSEMTAGFSNITNGVKETISSALGGYKILTDDEYAKTITALQESLKQINNEKEVQQEAEKTGTSLSRTNSLERNLQIEGFVNEYYRSGKASGSEIRQWENGEKKNISYNAKQYLLENGFTAKEIEGYLNYLLTEQSSTLLKGMLTMMPYATGGLNTQTGPAWLDGTPSRPELVLNAQDTQNFLMLKDLLADLNKSGFTTASNQNNGEINLEIYLNVEQGLSNDYDVEQLVYKVKQEIAKVGQERNIQILTKR